MVFPALAGDGGCVGTFPLLSFTDGVFFSATARPEPGIMRYNKNTGRVGPRDALPVPMFRSSRL